MVAEGRLGLRLPVALRAYYRLAGEAEINTLHNQLLPPEDLEVQEGHLLFMDENQGVVSWGVRVKDLGAPDPVVQQRNNTPPCRWFSERKRFTAFLTSLFRWYEETGVIGEDRA